MNSLFYNWTSTFRRNSLVLVLTILLATLGINAIIATKRIYTNFAPRETAISITALEKFAEDGIINGELSFEQQYLPAKKFQQFQEILHTPVKTSPVLLSEFLYTPAGEFILQRLAQALQPQSGIETLRTALIAAAGEPEGLTLLTLLRQYPHSSIHINLRRSFSLAQELENVISETQRAIAAVEKQSYWEAARINQPVDNLQISDLRQPGKFSLQKYTVNFFDDTRHRRLLTDVYIPHVHSPAPVIVISHGLGTDSSNFKYLAQHLASHGLAVVVPNHPGSISLHHQTNAIIEPGEFQNQPLDVKYVLNQLEKINQSDLRFRNRLNLDQVGVFGQSLGGYTSLALAGAEINFPQLEKDCQPETLNKSWNISLLFQCSALSLKHDSSQEYNLQDDRVKAAIAVNPITSAIFGEAGLRKIQTPIMIVSSSEDTVAPALYEQIKPFSWLKNAPKYLVTLLGGTHFSIIGDGNPASQQISLPTDLVGDATQAREYMNILTLPFFATYVAAKPEYLAYLNAGYIKSISHQSLGLNLVQNFSQTQISQVISPEKTHQTTSNPITDFGFWMLDVGIAMLRETIVIFSTFLVE
jgi:predicted dienelactone hydrolase